MQKIRTTVHIDGHDYTIYSYDDEQYVHRVAKYVDRKMSDLSAATHLPSLQLAVLTSMSVTDDMLKAHDEITRLRAELDAAREEIKAIKREIQSK